MGIYAILYPAIAACDTILKTDNLTPELLEPIVRAASDSHISIYEEATGLLGKVSKFPQACEAILKMSQDSRAHVRFNAILTLQKITPLPVALQVLRQRLRDKSVRVREMATDCAFRLALREMVPDLQSALTQECNPDVRVGLEFSVRLLRDGYLLEPDADGYSLTVVCINGAVVGQHVTESELKDRGIDAIVAKYAQGEGRSSCRIIP